MSEWYVYILRCADNSLYTGVATDLVARVSTHNAGKGAKYTRGRRPVVLVYREVVVDRAAAQRREAEIKRMPAEAKREFVRSHSGADNLSSKNGSGNLG